MATAEMKVERREKTGKNSSIKLRNDNYIPGVIYSKGEEAQHVKVSFVEFQRVYKSVGGASMFNLSIEDSKIPVIIKEIQKDPLGKVIYHVDFQKLNMDEKVKLTVPITILNRDNIRVQPSILVQLLDSIEIECLPKDIPNSAELDVEDIDFNTPKLVKDLQIANNPNITIMRDLEEVICTLNAPATTAEEEEAAADAEEMTIVEPTPPSEE